MDGMGYTDLIPFVDLWDVSVHLYLYLTEFDIGSPSGGFSPPRLDVFTAAKDVSIE